MNHRFDDAEELVSHHLAPKLGELSAEARTELIRHVADLLERAIDRERERNIRICLERAELWRNTLAADSDSPEHARTEARARANEARYLADMISTEPTAPAAADA